MTADQVRQLLQEIRGLERVEAGIRTSGTAVEWKYALTALDDRLRWCRYCLSLEHPLLVASVADALDADASAPPVAAPSASAPWPVLPPTTRIH